MHDAHLEHVLEGAADLEDVGPYLDLRNKLPSLSNLLDIILEIAFFGPFDRDEHFIVLNKTLKVFRYVSVLQFLHQLHLLYTIVSLFHVVDIEYLEQLERNELLGLDVLRLEHERELALSDWLEDLVVSVHAPVEVAVAN